MYVHRFVGGEDINHWHMVGVFFLLEVNRHPEVTWSGRHRPSLKDAEIAPRPIQKEIPVWMGGGGTLESAMRAGSLGIGMAVVILGGDPKKFMPLVEAYRKSGVQAGHNPEDLKVGVTGHGYISKTTQQAKDEYFPYYANYLVICEWNARRFRGNGKSG